MCFCHDLPFKSRTTSAPCFCIPMYHPRVQSTCHGVLDRTEVNRPNCGGRKKRLPIDTTEIGTEHHRAASTKNERSTCVCRRLAAQVLVFSCDVRMSKRCSDLPSKT